jgi:protein-disulfide isomerase
MGVFLRQTSNQSSRERQSQLPKRLDWKTGLLVAGALATTTAWVDHHAHATQIAAIASALDAAAQEGLFIGPADAPMTLFVFFNYRCGFCHQYEQSLRLAREAMVDQVRVVYLPYSLDGSEVSVPFRAATCAAANGRFALMHARLLSSDEVPFDSAGWRALADSLAMPDVGSFVECVQAPQLPRQVERAQMLAQRLAIHATPTSLLGDRIVVGAVPLADLLARIDSALQRQRAVQAGRMVD